MPCSSDFDFAVQHTLEAEGVLSEHPNDPGGLTKYGITKARWDAYASENGIDIEVQNINVEDARRFYYIEEWLGPNLNKLSDRYVASELFDSGVNCGHRSAGLFLQRAYNTIRLELWDSLREDGVIGPITRAAIKHCVASGYRKQLIHAMNGEQYLYYKSLPNTLRFKFIRGWMRRLHNWGL